MVKHPWPLLEISLSDFRRLATLNIYTYLPLESAAQYRSQGHRPSSFLCEIVHAL